MSETTPSSVAGRLRTQSILAFSGIGLVVLGAALALLGWVYAHVVTITAMLPLLVALRAARKAVCESLDHERTVQRWSDLHLATVESLARAISAKDHSSERHVGRMQAYAVGLARTIGMSDAEIQGVKTAALLHDIGKLAVPEHILSKPGPLTPEEFQKIRMHPQIGADIISSVPFPYPVAPVILSHHERWDGHGYPAGLRGEDIPLGARVLSVVDHYFALISDRAYHNALPEGAAIEVLRQEAGVQLDPTLVERFIDLRHQFQAEAGDAVTAADTTPAIVPKLEPPTRDARADRLSRSVFEDIALAHREIHALYEIAQSMGKSLGVNDTMTLISSKLASLVPFSCCALFLHNDETEVLHCHFATGTDSDEVKRLSLASGAGLHGWVAENRQPLVNARPSADFHAAGLTSITTSLQSVLVCPLVFNDRFIGNLAVYHLEPDHYTDDHRRLLDRVCEQAAAVIYNSILFEQTQEDSLTDPLTGLPNTRFMFMHLARELARARRLKAEVSLLVMDLDRFKHINDTYGHHVGDRALREIAAVLRATIRPYDICVRYAGDEFIVVLSGCGAEEAESKRLELQAAVDDAAFEVEPGQVLPLSLSVGAAVFPHDGDGYESLLTTADSRMYLDKRKRSLAPSSRPESEPAAEPAAVRG